MRLETAVWWRQAEADLETARQLVITPQAYAVSWFVQQAVEKGLKALYLEQRGALPPRTHDLEYLGSQLQVPTAVATDLALVNPAFDLVRYPDPTTGTAPVDIVTSALAVQHLDAAERVFEWLDTLLNPPSSQP